MTTGISWDEIEDVEGGSAQRFLVRKKLVKPPVQKKMKQVETKVAVCRPDVISEANKLVRLNEDVMERFVGTTTLLESKLRSCDKAGKADLLRQIDWEKHSGFVQRQYAETVLQPCINKMINENRIDQECIQNSKLEVERFLERDSKIRQTIELACPTQLSELGVLPLKQKTPAKKSKRSRFVCDGTKISEAIKSWLAKKDDKLKDKRLICFLGSDLTVKVGDTVGTHTVYIIDGKVAGIAQPKEEEDIQEESVSWLRSLLNAGVSTMQKSLSLILSTITFLTKMIGCGLSWFFPKLWFWKVAAVIVLLTLLVAGVLAPALVQQFMNSYLLWVVAKMLQMVRFLCYISNGGTSGVSGTMLYWMSFFFGNRLIGLLPGGQIIVLISWFITILMPLLGIACWALKGIDWLNSWTFGFFDIGLGDMPDTSAFRGWMSNMQEVISSVSVTSCLPEGFVNSVGTAASGATELGSYLLGEFRELSLQGFDVAHEVRDQASTAAADLFNLWQYESGDTDLTSINLPTSEQLRGFFSNLPQSAAAAAGGLAGVTSMMPFTESMRQSMVGGIESVVNSAYAYVPNLMDKTPHLLAGAMGYLQRYGRMI